MNIKNLTNEKKNNETPSVKVVEIESSVILAGSEKNGQTEGYGVNGQTLDDDDWV